MREVMEVGLTGCVSPKLEKQRQEVKSIEGQREQRNEFILDTWTLNVHMEVSRSEGSGSLPTPR